METVAAATGWRYAMRRALYGPAGFYTRSAPGPAGHFRTSAHAGSPLVASALLRLVDAVDAALGRPARLDLVDVGAGRGELLTTMVRAAPDTLARRLRPLAVERAPRPDNLPDGIGWTGTAPTTVTGVLLATEWLDNVPLDVAVADPPGPPRYLLVDPVTGAESTGEPVTGADARWIERWWPSPPADDAADAEAVPVRIEIGRTRDDAWAAAVGTVARGLALTVDYGHLRDSRPAFGTLTGYRSGRQVAPVPDGTCDVTAHVAVDSAAEAGGLPYAISTQRAFLRALGVDGRRPPLESAATDPAGYVRALAAASTAAELTDPAGLGGHFWLLHPRGIDLPLPVPLTRDR